MTALDVAGAAAEPGQHLAVVLVPVAEIHCAHVLKVRLASATNHQHSDVGDLDGGRLGIHIRINSQANVLSARGVPLGSGVQSTQYCPSWQQMVMPTSSA